MILETIETLDRLAVGQGADIVGLEACGDFRARLMALGFVPGSSVRAVLESPWGDPVAYEVCGAVIALRRADAAQIAVAHVT